MSPVLKIGPDRDAVVSFHSGSVMDWAPQEALAVKDLAGSVGDVKRCGLDPWVGKIPCRRKWQPTPVFVPGKSYGQRSLVGCSPWGHRVGHD